MTKLTKWKNLMRLSQNNKPKILMFHLTLTFFVLLFLLNHTIIFFLLINEVESNKNLGLYKSEMYLLSES